MKKTKTIIRNLNGMQLKGAEGDRHNKINDYKIAQEKAVKTVLKKVTNW